MISSALDCGTRSSQRPERADNMSVCSGRWDMSRLALQAINPRRRAATFKIKSDNSSKLLVLALSGHSGANDQCPLSGVEQTSRSMGLTGGKYNATMDGNCGAWRCVSCRSASRPKRSPLILVFQFKQSVAARPAYSIDVAYEVLATTAACSLVHYPCAVAEAVGVGAKVDPVGSVIIPTIATVPNRVTSLVMATYAPSTR